METTQLADRAARRFAPFGDSRVLAYAKVARGADGCAVGCCGRTGRVIGVDMTPEMVTKACGNARAVGATNVELRLGEIEHLPVSDTTVDAILSNCVINLSPDKASVFLLRAPTRRKGLAGDLKQARDNMLTNAASLARMRLIDR